jgi:hypothetical protein
MPVPMFTAEDSLYLSTQNYSNLDFWSIDPSDRTLRNSTPTLPSSSPLPCFQIQYTNCVQRAKEHAARCHERCNEPELTDLICNLRCTVIENEDISDCGIAFRCGSAPGTECQSVSSGNSTQRISSLICCPPCRPPGQLDSQCNCKVPRPTRPPNKRCRAGRAMCGNRCKDTNTDESNCGYCGYQCLGGRTCQSGLCLCPPDKPNVCLDSSWNSTYCVNKKTDKNNCGSCGNQCASGEHCSEGNCCLLGWHHCGSGCCPDGAGCCPNAQNPCVDTYGNPPSKVECCGDNEELPCIGHCTYRNGGWGCDSY